MKKKLTISSFIFLFCLSFSISKAQIEVPAPSPLCKMEQKVGLTDIAISYSRPSLKGRVAFVDIEEYGKIWRTGANAATTISFSDDVQLEGKNVPAGTYAIYSIPGKEEWTVMIYKDLSIGGNVAAYDQNKELIRFKVKSKKGQRHIESFTIDINDLKTDGATVNLMWSDIVVPINMKVDTDSRVMASIEGFAKNPNASLLNQYASAANYYYANGKDLNKALDWINKAVEINPKAFWHMQTKAKILAKMKNYKKAIETANQSMSLAKAAPSDFGYIKSNEKLIAEWSKN